MIKLYLASAYSDPDPAQEQANYSKAVDACAKLHELGYLVYSPIVHWHIVAKSHNLNGSAEYWVEYAFAFIQWCDILCVLKTPNYSKSKGVKGEIKFAKKLGKPVMYFPWE